MRPPLKPNLGLRRRGFTMETIKTPTPSVFSPLAKALLDGFSEGVVVFDREGKVLYANSQARAQLADQFDLSTGADELMPRLAALGGRVRPLRAYGLHRDGRSKWSPTSSPSA